VRLRVAIIAAIGVAVLLAVSQLILPGIGEGEIEDRLTENGGSAEASLSAVPAARLLWGDGDRFEVSGSGLDLELTRDAEVFDRLDGFGDVRVDLADFRAGPFEVSSFELTRDGSRPYSVRSSSTTTPANLLDYGAEQLGIGGGPLLRFLAGQTPRSDLPIPIELEMEMESDDGRVQVVSGGGTVAGFPTGPLAELITAAIVVRL